MKDVTVEKAESLVDQIQEVRERLGGKLQRRLLGTGGAGMHFLFSQTGLFTL